MGNHFCPLSPDVCKRLESHRVRIAGWFNSLTLLLGVQNEHHQINVRTEQIVLECAHRFYRGSDSYNILLNGFR